MRHVRSRLSHLARLACHLLAATLVRRPKVLTTSSPWFSKRPDPAPLLAPWSGSGHCIDGWYGGGGGVACGVGMKFGMN